MSRSALAAGIRQLRCKLSGQQPNQDSDEQLLHAFLTRRDDGAFAVLMRRHGPMVLHVCRRVLGQEQDAEDAFQATFLVLARKAAVLRNKTSLAGFLHGIAYRTAMKAKQTAARRRKYEEKAPTRPSDNPTEQLLWSEVRQLLDEEIARLPEAYRSVFVLCCLEELSQAEAGRRLGLEQRTVSNRLARARKRLAQRLARRGVDLTAVLAASTLVASQASALAPLLMTTTIKAALATAAGEGVAGLVSASVAVLARNSWPMLGVGKAKLAVVLLIAGLCTAGAGIVMQRALPVPRQGQDEDAVSLMPSSLVFFAAHESESKDKTAILKVRGRVFDPDGKPVKGARLYSPQMRKDAGTRKEDITVAQRGISDTDGRFSFDLSQADMPPRQDRALVVAADGYGVQWIELPGENSAAELKLRLVRDQAIEGRIINTEGQPVAGAHIEVVSLKTGADDRVDDFLTAWQGHWGLASVNGATRRLTVSLDRILPGVSTDKAGRFRIAGIGAERVAEIKVHGDGIARTSLFVVCRPGFDPAAVNKTALQHARVKIGNSRPPLLYGPVLEYIAEPGCTLEGTIRAADSGDPLAGFSISYPIGFRNSVRAISDNQGRFRLDGMPKTRALPLQVEPPANSPWLGMDEWIKDAETVQPPRVEIRVPRGVRVTGRVIDRATGKGVQSAVRFVPLPDNRFFENLGAKPRQLSDFTTDAEGRFRMAVPSGPGVLAAEVRAREKTKGGREIMPYKQAEFDEEDRPRVQMYPVNDGTRAFLTASPSVELLNTLNAVKYVDFAPNAAAATCDLFVDRGKTMTIRIEDEEGKPLTGATVAGVTDAWFIHASVFTLANTESACTIYALDPERPRRLIFFHPKRNLACTFLLRGDEETPPTARLARTATVTGRVLDQEGKPIVGADIGLSSNDLMARKFFAQLQAMGPTIRTGADGRFRIEGLVPELRLGLNIHRGRAFLFNPHGELSLHPGETRNLGDIRTQPQP